jgi:putative ABC transport system permease protein
MSIFLNYLIVAIRNLKRQKIYTLINVLGLTIGFISCLIIFMWVNYHLSFDNFHKNRDNIYRSILDVKIDGLTPMQHCGSLEWVGPTLKQDYPDVVNYVRLFKLNRSISLHYHDNESVIYSFYFTDRSFFEFFDFDFLYGNSQKALMEPKSLILSQQLSKKIFGDENPVGKILEIDEHSTATVTGVLKKLPDNSHLQFDMLALFPNKWLLERQTSEQYKRDAPFYTYIMLPPGVDHNEFNKKITRHCDKYLPELSGKLGLYLQPLNKLHLHSGKIEFDHNHWRKVDILFIYIFSSVAFLILFIACINFINLSMAQYLRRSKEVGIRKVIGAQRFHLIIQFVGESVLLCFFAILFTGIFLEVILPMFGSLFNGEIDFIYSNKILLYGVMAVSPFCVGILAGIYPALSMSQTIPQKTIKAVNYKGQKGTTLRKIFVTIQFCVSIFFIVCSFFIVKQLNWISNKDLGFNKEQVITFKMPAEIQKNFNSIRQELLNNIIVSDISTLGPSNFPGFLGKMFHFEGQTQDQSWLTSCTAVGYDFIRFFDLKIVEGRDFSESMRTDAQNAYIINETLKKKLGWDTAVGKKFHIPDFNEKPGQIIGVVKDFNFESLHHEIDGLAMFVKPDLLNWMTARVATANIDSFMEIVKEKWAQYAPSAQFEYQFLDQIYENQYRGEKAIGKIVNTFSILAIFVACLGLLGLVSYTAELRTKEIGVRKVLGASIMNVILMISKEFIFLLSLAAVIAWPIAYCAMNKWFQNFIYQIELSWWVFLSAGMIALGIALLTVFWKVLRVATANPIKSLRYE